MHDASHVLDVVQERLQTIAVLRFDARVRKSVTVFHWGEIVGKAWGGIRDTVPVLAMTLLATGVCGRCEKVLLKLDYKTLAQTEKREKASPVCCSVDE